MHGKDLSPHIVLHPLRRSVTHQTIFVVVVVLLLRHFLTTVYFVLECCPSLKTLLSFQFIFVIRREFSVFIVSFP